MKGRRALAPRGEPRIIKSADPFSHLRAEGMRRSTAAKLLVVVLALLAGLASSFKLLRRPSRLRGDLEDRDYTLVRFSPDGKTLITVERPPHDCRIRLW